MERNAHVDFLRGISIVVVILGHSLRYGGFWIESFPPSLAIHIQNGAYYGVTVFFVVSGFLITSKFSRADGGRLNVDAARFYIQRIGRILPPLMLLLLTSACLAGIQGQTTTLTSISEGLFSLLRLDFISAAKQIPNVESSLDPLWSLGIEEKFYIFFPMLCLLLPTPRSLTTVIFISVVLGFVFRLTNDNIWTFFATFDQLAIGCFAALYRERIASYATEKWKVSIYLLSMCLLCFLYYALDPFDSYSVTLIACCAATTIIYAPPSWTFKNKITFPILKFGYLSYEMYLVHMLVLYFTFSCGLKVRENSSYGVENLIFIVFQVYIIYIISALIERYYSRPANEYIRKKWAPAKIGNKERSRLVG